MKLGTWPTCSLAIGAVLLVAGIALAFNNPTTDIPGEVAHQFFAPYDTILFGQRDNVGMPDHPREIDRVLTPRCCSRAAKFSHAVVVL